MQANNRKRINERNHITALVNTINIRTKIIEKEDEFMI